MNPPSNKATCGQCDAELVCPDCHDSRPRPDQVYPRCRILSPFGRWETVERVDDRNRFGSVRIWTAEAGPDFSWSYARWERLDVILPAHDGRESEPEVRVVEVAGADGWMYVLAVGKGHTFGLVPPVSMVLAESRPAGREKGWWVADMGSVTAVSELVRIEVTSKAHARTQIRAIARKYAKMLNVSLNITNATKY